MLIAAIALAILYFGLMELMLMESQRTLREAQRFRSKIIATTLAENAAELAAENICKNFASTIDYTNGDGTMKGEMKREPPVSDGGPSPFKITVSGTSSGVPSAVETVQLDGNVKGLSVEITYSDHSTETKKGGL